MMRLLSVLALLALLASAARLPAADHLLAGSWKIDLTRSTELSPWKDYDLTIAVDGPTITLQRRLAWGRREFKDAMSFRTDRPEKVPVEMWPDNRHLGAYIGGDKTKRVHATWLDDRRVLRLSSDLTLSTSQGDRTINVLSDYKVSANGAQLTLTELRSTRNQPVVHTFTRVDSPRP